MANCALGLKDYTKLGKQIAMRIDNEEGGEKSKVKNAYDGIV